MSKPVVSVVTPFHNTAEFLPECIESVLGQDFEDFEYILVDNASTDDSGRIAAEYGRIDNRIKLFQTERPLTQVENYNFALAQISSESKYCKIVQADDWIFPRCLVEMVGLAEANPDVGVVSAYELKENRVWGEHLKPSERVLDGRVAGRLYILDEAHMFGSPTTVLLRADLVRARQEFFDHDRLHEDTEVIFELLLESSFGFVHQVLAFTREQPGSISAGRRDFLTQKLEQLVVVSRYGPHYLTQKEFDECWRRERRDYYRALARRWLKDIGRQDRRFWEYQREGLSTFNERLEPFRIAYEMIPGLVARLLNIGPNRSARSR